jgi:hypothetical protein
VLVTSVPAPPLWRSRSPGCSSLRTPVTIVTRTSASSDSPGLHHVINYLPNICHFLSFFPDSALMSLCVPCPDAVRVKFPVCLSLTVIASCLPASVLTEIAIENRSTDQTKRRAAGFQSFQLVGKDWSDVSCVVG